MYLNLYLLRIKNEGLIRFDFVSFLILTGLITLFNLSNLLINSKPYEIIDNKNNVIKANMFVNYKFFPTQKFTSKVVYDFKKKISLSKPCFFVYFFKFGKYPMSLPQKTTCKLILLCSFKIYFHFRVK